MTTPPCTDIELPPLHAVVQDDRNGLIGIVAERRHKDGYVFIDMGAHVEWGVPLVHAVTLGGWTGRQVIPGPRSAPPIESYTDDDEP